MRTIIPVLLLMAGLAGCIDADEPAAATSMRPDGQWSHLGDTLSVFPGMYSFEGPGAKTLTPGPYGVSAVTSQMLESGLDGADIDLSYWLPTGDAGNGPWPVIIQASPYFPRTDAPGGSQNFGHWMHDEFVPHGYVYAQLAIRSTAESGGCDDFRGPNMSHDIAQALDWLMDQDWANGHAALIGKSYPGSTPWYAAGTGHPAVKTIVPVSGSTNAWEVYLRNGTPESRAAIIVPNYGVTAAANTDRSPQHKVENFACTEVWEAWVNGVSDGVLGDRLHDAWWDERNSKPGVEANYQGSILLVHGLEDWNVDPAVAIPWTQQLADSGLEVKQFLGQWAHDHPDQGSDATKRWDWAEILLRWFDRELKGMDVDVGPPVQVQSNDGRWRDEAAWPPKDAEHRVLHLGSGSLDAEAGGHGAVQFSPANAAQTEVWRMAVEAALRIAGLPLVHVTVTPTGPSGYLGAILYDEAPDGSRDRIGWTGMNFRFHAGGEDPQTVTPGEDIVLRMQLQPLDAFVPAGHTLALDLGFITPSDRIQPAHPYPFTLHHGEGYTAKLVLPVVERGEEAFFEPPMPPAQP